MDMQMTGIMEWEQMRGVPAGRDSGEKPPYRRPISRAERIRIQKKRKRMARRRRRQKIFRLCQMMIVLSAILLVMVKIVTAVFDFWMEPASDGGTEAEGFSVAALFDTDRNEAGYEVKAPEIIEEEDIKPRLLAMSETYPEIKEIYEHADEYPENLLACLCNNPEMTDYVKGYLSAEQTAAGGLTKKELKEWIPLLLQWDERWGYVPFGDNVIGLSGCAPTCLSMVVVGLTGNSEATPDAIAQYAMDNGHYVMGTGTAWSLMTEGGQAYGVYGRELPLGRGSVMDELENGHPIICSMRAGDFTTSGHFIVLTGVEDGKIRVNDPNSRSRSRLWDYETLEWQISNLWSFTN